jgi:hypothetical protein
MANTLTVNNEPYGLDQTQKRIYVHGIISLTGSYTTGGETLNWQAMKYADGEAVLLDTSDTQPEVAYFQSVGSTSGGSSSGWLYQWNKKTGKLQIFGTGSGAGASHQEMANSTAYSSTTPPITTDLIEFEAEFVKEV